MAWPCITRACCMARFWSQLDKADIAVPLVFANYSDACDTVQSRAQPGSSGVAIETQPGGDGSAQEVVSKGPGAPTAAASSGSAQGSVTRQDFKAWKVRREPSCKPKREYHEPEVPLDTETQYQKDYKPWPLPRRDHPWIPKASQVEQDGGVEKGQIADRVQEKEILKSRPSKKIKEQTDKGLEVQQELQKLGGRAAVDALNRQIKDEVSAGSSYRLCSVKLCSVSELEEHERGRVATPPSALTAGLRFSNTLVKKDHEAHCKYKKLTCLECMRTFKSSFSIWRHQVEVHNQNMMTVREQLTFGYHDLNQETQEVPGSSAAARRGGVKDEAAYGDSEDSSSYLPEDLSSNHSQGKLVVKVKEEPQEEPVMDRSPSAPEEADVRPCEKCGKLFSSHKALERHQELLCHIKPFICHICHKAFRTNFRLWSHYQSHMSSSNEPVSRQTDRPSCSPPPSPTLTQEPLSSRASPPKSSQAEVTVSEEEPRGLNSPLSKAERAEQEKPGSEFSGSHSENPAPSQEPDTLFYHAPTLSALTFKRQYMCKLCHRTFKTAFSLWSHEQSHSHV
ncbi:Zinc finger and BTB domain-containing protein 21 [Bagarius yarrelli]|uniref:Zinc finger and BTB domain-containing protein 21 n=1 Tax=Bagarius yarrelli TaxID=175774 RepID=A0A556VUU8_BAGYA|nr:Zinc finger and BTB domain-containing protein 21 [Bagarius yarrelli]